VKTEKAVTSGSETTKPRKGMKRKARRGEKEKKIENL